MLQLTTSIQNIAESEIFNNSIPRSGMRGVKFRHSMHQEFGKNGVS